MQVVPPPDPIATESTLAGWKRIRNRQIRMPASDSSERDRWRRSWRPIGDRLPAYVADGPFELQFFSLFFVLGAAHQIVRQNWEMVAIGAAIFLLNLLAGRYAKRAEPPHRFGRILCAIYFATVRDSATRRPVRRRLRLSVLFALAPLLLFSLWPLSFGHDRPPLVDPRIFSRSGHWDYLREHHFFRDPPPSAQPPENQPP